MAEFEDNTLVWDDAQALHEIDPEDLEPTFWTAEQTATPSEDETTDSDDEDQFDLSHGLDEPAIGDETKQCTLVWIVLYWQHVRIEEK